MKKRKLLLLGVAFLLLFAALSVSGCAALGSLYEDGDMLFRYRADIDGYVLLSYEGTATEVVIPAEVNGKPVRRIGAMAFDGCEGIVSLTVPNSVERIYKGAFRSCYKSIERLSIPFLGTEANQASGHFGEAFGASALTTLHQAISCPIKHVEITGNTFIPDSAFVGYVSIETVTLGEGVTKIGTGAFQSLPNLKTVKLPSTLEKIGSRAFYKCGMLSNITFPDAVYSIGTSAFGDCELLTSIKLPSNLQVLGAAAFKGCYQLGEIVFPVGVRSVYDETFYNTRDDKRVYYMGGADDWASLNIGKYNDYFGSRPYFYSEEEPTDTANAYWHYVNGVPTPW